MIYQKQKIIKTLKKFHLPQLDSPCGKSTSLKFGKDPSTRGNSPNFLKPKDENEANSSFNKNLPINLQNKYLSFSIQPTLSTPLELDLRKEIKNISTRSIHYRPEKLLFSEVNF